MGNCCSKMMFVEMFEKVKPKKNIGCHLKVFKFKEYEFETSEITIKMGLSFKIGDFGFERDFVIHKKQI